MLDKILSNLGKNLINRDVILDGYSELAARMLNYKKRKLDNVLAETLSSFDAKILPEDVYGWKIGHRAKIRTRYNKRFGLEPLLYYLCLPPKKFSKFLKKNNFGNNTVALYFPSSEFGNNNHPPLYFNIFGMAVSKIITQESYNHESLHQARFFYSKNWSFLYDFKKSDTLKDIKLKAEASMFDEITAYSLTWADISVPYKILIKDDGYLFEIKKECYPLKNRYKKVKLKLRKYFMDLKKRLPEIIEASYYLKSCLELKYLSKIFLAIGPTYAQYNSKQYDSLFDDILCLADNFSRNRQTIDRFIKVIKEKGY